MCDCTEGGGALAGGRELGGIRELGGERRLEGATWGGSCFLDDTGAGVGARDPFEAGGWPPDVAKSKLEKPESLGALFPIK